MRLFARTGLVPKNGHLVRPSHREQRIAHRLAAMAVQYLRLK